MWLLLALGSALFAGVTAVLAKAGLQDTDSHLATALRTGVVLVFSWLIVFLNGLGIFSIVRCGNRLVLAVLFSRAAAGRCA